MGIPLGTFSLVVAAPLLLFTGTGAGWFIQKRRKRSNGRAVLISLQSPRCRMRTPTAGQTPTRPMVRMTAPGHAACRWTWRSAGTTTGSTPWPACAPIPIARWPSPALTATLSQALARLDDLADGADFLLGHNLIDFDLPHLRAANPNLRLLQLPAVDTLRLNPLAFPRNPYHYLVKHYQDGSLRRGRLNDPELDAPPGAGSLHRPAEGFPRGWPRPAHRLALAHRRERRRGLRSPLLPAAPGAAAVGRGGIRAHRTPSRRSVMPDAGCRGRGGCRTASLRMRPARRCWRGCNRNTPNGSVRRRREPRNAG